jgi:hypothetical protein
MPRLKRVLIAVKRYETTWSTRMRVTMIVATGRRRMTFLCCGLTPSHTCPGGGRRWE